MARITCGNCKMTHFSAADVRSCYQGLLVSFDQPAPAARKAEGVAYSTTRWAKDNMTSAAAPAPVSVVATMAEAREILSDGAVKVKLGRGKSAWTTVQDGAYAIEEFEDGAEEPTVKFYKIKHGKPGGRWEGWLFIDAQASDELWAIKDAERKARILAAIGVDIPGAMALYGKELGKCGHCGRTLTSEWRKRGIGPVCAKKMGFAA
jgi:hypothetical protein